MMKFASGMKRDVILPPSPAELPEAEELDLSRIVDGLLSGETDMLCVLGPTASGKTRYAVSLARKIGNLLSGRGSSSVCEIISADSRQVYRGMTIGTGKDLKEYGEVPYHLVDIVPAGTKYDIFYYQRDFCKVYQEIKARGNIPVLCGGSGLYIEAVTRGYELPDVPPDPHLREMLEKESTENLIKRLASLKHLHNTTDYDTRKRLVRALEIAIYESEHPVSRNVPLPLNTFFIGTLVSREERNARIDRRLDMRLSEGMVEEVRSLLEGLPESAPEGPREPIQAEDLIYYGLEYKFITRYLLSELSYDEMKSGLATAIHQFAKRQMTWFRGMERKGITIHWVRVEPAL